MTLQGRNTAVVPNQSAKTDRMVVSNAILPPGERKSHGLFADRSATHPWEGPDHAARFRLADATRSRA